MIVGAGMSGLVAAHRLQQAGIDFVVIEKNDDVGGTWFENRYPGCRVDVPNHLYSYSFAQRADWPQQFSPQDMLLDYFRACADDLELTEHIRFGTEVISADYREEHGDWLVTVRAPDGADETLVANVLVSAVGQLNRPSVPDIAGRDTFAGRSFHSAEWDHSRRPRGQARRGDRHRRDRDPTDPRHRRRGRRVARVPAHTQLVHADAAVLLGDARRDAVAARQRAVLQPVVPLLALLAPVRRFAPRRPASTPTGPPTQDRSARSTTSCASCSRSTSRPSSPDAPELLDEVVPDYPPLAKRILLDNGIWAATLKRDHVHLERLEVHMVSLRRGPIRVVEQPLREWRIGAVSEHA